VHVGDEAVVDDAEEAREQRIRLDVYHHFPDGIQVQLSGGLILGIGGDLTVTVVEPTPPPPPVATSARIIVTPTGGKMPGQITVDTTNETATLEWLDDKGDTNAAAPSNASGAAVVTFTSDNAAVATVGTGNPAAVTPVAEGTANIGATIAYPDGTAVLEADGVTPFPTPATVAVTVGPGAAVGDALVLSV
jgi:hypothetical protein